MRRDLMLAIGLAAVMVFATSAAAHCGAFFGAGFGPSVHPFFAAPHSHAAFAFGTPAHPFFVRPRSHVFFSFGFGALVPPLVVVPPVLVAPPAGIVPHAVLVITPRRF